MKELTSTVGAIIGAIAFIVVGAWYVSVYPRPETIRYEQIQTDSATKYPHQASSGRCYFVEQVD